MRSLLLRIASLGLDSPRRVFAGAALLAAATVLLLIVKPPRIDSDFLDLLPSDQPAVRDFRMATADFKSLDYLFVLLRSDAPAESPASSFEEFADLLAEKLRRLDGVESVEYRLQDYEGVVRAMAPHALLYLSPTELDEVATLFSDSGIRAQVRKNRELLSNPASILTKELVRMDPFGMLPVLQRRFAGRASQLQLDTSDGYYLSRDGSALLLIVRPRKPAQDIVFGKRLMEQVRASEAAVRDQLAREGADADLAGMRVSYAGGYPIAQADFRLIMRDAVLNTVSSLALVFFLYIWAFRIKSSLAYAFVPLLLGMLVTFGVVHLLGFRISSATAGYGALLIGLGIDFPTVLYGRYIEERNRGAGVREAVFAAMGDTGRGVWVGAVTTAVTFAAMLLTHFPGMHQVALLTSSGILIVACSVFLLLPAMIRFHHDRHREMGSDPVLHMHVFGLDRIGHWARRYPRSTLASAGLFTALSVFLALGLRFDGDVQNLRSPGNEGITASVELARTFGASLTYMMAVVDGKTPEEVVEKSARVEASVRPFVREGSLLFYDGLPTFLPPPAQQDAALARLREGSSDAFDPARIRATFTRACAEEGFDPAFFAPYLDALPATLAPRGRVTFGTFEAGPAEGLVSKYIVRKGADHYRSVVYLYVPEDPGGPDPDRLAAAVRAAVPDARVAGISLLGRALRNLVSRDAAVAFLVGLLAVLLIVALDFRSFSLGFYSLVPLFLGLVWMLGTMRLFGAPLNIMNVFVTTLVLGIGSDYGIHLVHRWREGRGGDLGAALSDAGKPVAIAALTTMAGFGSMSLSSYPGLRSMGYVSLLGTFFCMLATLTVLVALLALRTPPDRGGNEGDSA